MRPLRAIVDFWTRPVRAEPLALFRILLGLTAIAAQLTGSFSSLALTCGPDGLCPMQASDDWVERTGRVQLLGGPSGLPLLSKWLPADLAKRYPRLEGWVPDTGKAAWAEWGERLSSHYLLYSIYLAALLGLTLGFRPRLMALVAVFLGATFHHRLGELMNGGDALLRNGYYFLVLAPSGATWSIDQLLRRRRARLRGVAGPEEPVMVEPWSLRLMQIQLCCVYFFTGTVKLGEDYFNGVALYWVLNDVSLTRWPFGILPLPLLLCRVMCWGTLAYELSFSLLVWIRPLRRWILLAGISLHLGILLTIEVGWFSQVTLCWYALFVRGETLARWEGRGERVAAPAVVQPEAG